MSDAAAIGEDDVEVAIEAAQGSAAVGRVLRTGPRAAVLLNKQVLVGAIDPCGGCEVCRRGGAAACPFAVRRPPFPTEPGDVRAVVAGRWVTALDRGLELPLPAGAAVAGDVAIAYTLYARTGPAPREPVVVVGASPVTRFLVDILVAKDISPTVVADPADEAWCATLLARGVAIARVPRAASGDEARHAVTATVAAHQKTDAPGRPWRVIATSPDGAARAAALANPRSMLVLLAPVDELPGDLVAREVTVIGVAGAHPDLVVEAAAMCVKGEIDLTAGTIGSTGDPTRSFVAHLSAP